ncbi:hypothetical protein [Hymenobacter jejuensis]|uniref:Uncharacterized protein n=1 Tax=Hymenobacter jejuensis TaxID=2502781 RepID=A0A5B7ZWF1_9BACT|nr:hypothetical protein [Hymenobacter jejuensis]QDA59461.1 hypothetical protein FHG12_04780 [Hymenobacter jejuensis]
MTISHRATDASAATQTANNMKVVRMACCCKLSDLLPIVRQLHEAARANNAAATQTTQTEAA